MKPLFRFRKVQIWNALIKLNTNIKPTDIEKQSFGFFCALFTRLLHKALALSVLPWYNKAELFSEKLDISKTYKTIS